MSAFIDFDVIDEAGVQSFEGKLTLSPADLERPELEGGAEVSLELEASRGEQRGEYLVDGTIELSTNLVCGRCLEPYPFAHRSSFTLRYLPRPEVAVSELEAEVEEEELDLEYYTERKIPLRELAAEQVQLSIPMKLLCREDCPGLCLVCGANKSRVSCTCTAEAGDERWEALRQIREQLEEKKGNA